MDLHFSSDTCLKAELPPRRSSVDDRSSVQYSKWLQQLTINAVGRALQCLSYLTTVLIQSNYHHAKAKSGSKQSECWQDEEESPTPSIKDRSVFHFMRKFPLISTLSLNNDATGNGKCRSSLMDSEDQIRSVQTIRSLISSSPPLQDRSFLQPSARPHSMKPSSPWPIQQMHHRSLSCSPKHRDLLEVWKSSPRRSFQSEENACQRLDFDPEEHHHTTAKITTLLLQWHGGDRSQEWRSQVLSAAEMFQEAICQQFGDGDGNVINQALLESQLLYVLRHFEAGNGICLLMRSEPVHPLRPAYSHSSNNTSAVDCAIPDNGASKKAAIDHSTRTGMRESPTFGSLVQVEVRGAQLRSLGQCHSGRGRICGNKLDALMSSTEEEEEEEEEAEEEDKKRSDLDCCRLVTTLVTTKLKHGNDWRFSAAASALRESPSATAGGRRLHMKAAFWFGCGTREMKVDNDMEESAVEFSMPESQSSAAGLQESAVECSILASHSGAPGLQESAIECSIPESQSGAAGLQESAVECSILESQSGAAGFQESAVECSIPESQSGAAGFQESAVECSILESQSGAAALPSTGEMSFGCLPESAANTSTAAINPDSDHAMHPYLEEDAGDEITAAGAAAEEEEDEQRQHQEEESRLPPQQDEMREAELRFIESARNVEQSRQEESEGAGQEGKPGPSRVSLMMLMMRQESGLSSQREGEGEGEGEGGEDWESWEEPTEQLDPQCCICMVGLKGSAFVPCGHTFCRRCSRELWRNRGTCPLCNISVRQILDIY